MESFEEKKSEVSPQETVILETVVPNNEGKFAEIIGYHHNLHAMIQMLCFILAAVPTVIWILFTVCLPENFPDVDMNLTFGIGLSASIIGVAHTASIKRIHYQIKKLMAPPPYM